MHSLQKTLAITILTAASWWSPARADTPVVAMEDTREVGLLAGLVQVAAGGANLQLEATYGRFVFDYSHGWSLEPPVAGEQKDQALALRLPWTTGFGVGYRFTRRFDVRFEPKLHKFDVFFDGDRMTSTNRITSYRTATLGFGAYYKYRPFESSTG